MIKQKYTKALNPYVLTTKRLSEIEASDPGIIFNSFLTPVIPISGQSWLKPKCPNVKTLIYACEDAWCLRVGYGGDDSAGHIGTAFCPFMNGQFYELTNKENTKTLSIHVLCINPVRLDDGWYWRVEWMTPRINEKLPRFANPE